VGIVGREEKSIKLSLFIFVLFFSQLSVGGMAF
jgi:hypothetical protein